MTDDGIQIDDYVRSLRLPQVGYLANLAQAEPATHQATTLSDGRPLYLGERALRWSDARMWLSGYTWGFYDDKHYHPPATCWMPDDERTAWEAI